MQALKLCKEADLLIDSQVGDQRRADIRQLMANSSDLEAQQKMIQMATLFHTIKQNQSLSRWFLGFPSHCLSSFKWFWPLELMV